MQPNTQINFSVKAYCRYTCTVTISTYATCDNDPYTAKITSSNPIIIILGPNIKRIALNPNPINPINAYASTKPLFTLRTIAAHLELPSQVVRLSSRNETPNFLGTLAKEIEMMLEYLTISQKRNPSGSSVCGCACVPADRSPTY